MKMEFPGLFNFFGQIVHSSQVDPRLDKYWTPCLQLNPNEILNYTKEWHEQKREQNTLYTREGN